MAQKFDRGRYRIEVTNQILAKNKKDNWEFQIHFKFLGYYDPSSKELIESDCDQQTRVIFLVLTQATVGTPEKPGWVLSLLRELGFQGTSFAELSLEHEDPFSLVGKQFDANCDPETYEGKLREKWYLQTSSRITATPLTKQDMKQMASQLDGVLKGSTGPAKKGKKNNGTPPKGEKVPF